MKATPKGFIKAHYRKIPIYYNPVDRIMGGRNLFYEILMVFVMYFDVVSSKKSATMSDIFNKHIRFDYN